MTAGTLPAPIADVHARPSGEVAAALEVDPTAGLSSGIAEQRYILAGPNELEEVRRPSLLRIVWDSFTEPFILLLVVAGALAVALGEVRDGAFVLLMIGPMVGADVITEYRAERALEALRAAAAPMARVRRDASVEEIPAARLVPGDVVLLRVGDVAPADLRLVRTEGLAFDRSALTGESLPEAGREEPDPAGAPLAERHSVAFAGTSVVAGRGEGIVVATGLRTEFGRISTSLAGQDRRRSPLQRELDRLVRILLVIAIGLIAITTGLGFLRGNPATDNLMAGISAAIASIPEEPPVLFAVILGLGAYRLLRRGVLVRRLNAQETLGAVDLILTDKTGTLTQNRLALTALRTPGGVVADPERQRDLLLSALRAEEDAWSVAAGARPGSFTRSLTVALGEAGGNAELDPAELLEGEPVSDERPYSRTRALRAGVAEDLALGAPEAVLALARDLPSAEHDAWHALIERGADAGERLLLLAGRPDDEPWRPLALVGFADRLREGIGDSMRLASAAGIQTIIVTGDHPRTAAAIARDADMRGNASSRARSSRPGTTSGCDRSCRRWTSSPGPAPEDKLRLVDAARATGRTVAVTGDGVNDSPALQHADVAVAMGSGSAVAREASDLILGDDSFATLMYGLREGRRIVANVQKGLVFLVSTHVAMLGFILIATIAGYSQPLLPIQILWLEVFIDMLTVMSFEIEREEPDAMRVPSAAADASAAGRRAAGADRARRRVQRRGRPGDHGAAPRWVRARPLARVHRTRRGAGGAGERESEPASPSAGPAAESTAAGGGIATVVVQAMIPYVPAVAGAFRATPLDLADWALVAAVALLPALVAEGIRGVGHRRWVA